MQLMVHRGWFSLADFYRVGDGWTIEPFTPGACETQTADCCVNAW